MKIVIKNVKRENIEILQSELLRFFRSKIDNLPSCTDYQNYCNDILVIDLLQSLFYLLRRKIESQKKTCNLTLTPWQGVIILYCASENSKDISKANSFVMQNLTSQIHQDLINII